MDIGKIIITYGKLNEELSLDMGKSVILEGGESNWNKLVDFLRKAYSHNIGKTINY